MREATLLPLLVFALLAALPATGQDFSAVEIETIDIAPGVHMLMGRGGNIGVSSGPDGLVLIDDQYAPLHAKIAAAVAAIQPGAVRFVLNTHWHGDHTGGNEAFGKAGSVIVAHDAVRARMSVEQVMEAFGRTVPPSPPAALPVLTFADEVTLHLNGDELHVLHVPGAHTDGDAIVHFRRANVVHMGDTFFAGRYPFIDLGSGGSLGGMIAAVDRVLALCDGETRIIPGHGPLVGREELTTYRGVLAAASERVGAALAAGKSLEQVLADRPMADFDEAWGAGFIDAEAFLKITYASLSAEGDGR